MEKKVKCVISVYSFHLREVVPFHSKKLEFPPDELLRIKNNIESNSCSLYFPDKTDELLVFTRDFLSKCVVGFRTIEEE